MDKFRKEVVSLGVVHEYSPAFPVVTVSVGIAMTTPADEYIDAKEFLKRADQALYLAKHQGRNRVVLL
jgi:diguanylate cyclase (GGDEF)-like protein